MNYLLLNNDMQECRDGSEIYNCKWIQLSSDKFINEIWGVCLAWLDFFAAKGVIYRVAKTTVILDTWPVSHLWLYDNMVSC